MSLHITGKDGLCIRIEDNRHLEEEHIIGCNRCAGHLIAHAVEVVAIAEEFATEAAKD